MTHPDEVVQPEEEIPSQLIAEAKFRHEQAGEDTATDQEKKQAAVEEAHSLSTRPDGSYAQLHEGETPTVAVADDGDVAELHDRQEEVEKAQEAPADAAAPKKTAPAAAPAKSAPPK